MKHIFIIFLLVPRLAFALAPTVLYDSDVATYKEVFSLQKAGKMTLADKEIKKIKNDVLMGYVLYQRYMSPNYKTKFSEAKAWLANYYDQPNANDIYKLGIQKGAKKELRAPKKEGARNYAAPSTPPRNYEMLQYMPTYRKYAKKERGDVLYLIKMFNKRIKEGKADAARGFVEGANAKKLFAKDDYLRVQAYLAYAYFFEGNDEMAILWAKAPSEQLDYHIADWTLGLAYWREGNFLKSRDYFTKIASQKYLPTDVVSGAAYWAWRANSKLSWSERVNGDNLLKIAAQYPKSFYGVLANRRLDEKLKINWDEPEFTLAHTQAITEWRGGLRALALLQLDMKKEGAAELRFLLNSEDNADENLTAAVIALSEVANLPGLSINLAGRLPQYSDAAKFSSPQYPILDIAVAGGWKMDKALINAIIRQESRFNPDAKSWVGARGLMQIMPATASFIMGDASLRKKNRDHLFDEEKNLEIGQVYIEYLLSMPAIDNNLFKFLVAYNAGPGNLARQENRIKNPDDDPILFVESISIKETRIYIKRVMANLWIYRNRLGQESDSLDHLMDDKWPLYSDKMPQYKPRWTEEQEAELQQYLSTVTPEEPAAEEPSLEAGEIDADI